MSGRKADLPAGRRRHGSSTCTGSIHGPALQALFFWVPGILILPSANARGNRQQQKAGSLLTLSFLAAYAYIC